MSRCVFGAISTVQPRVLTPATHQGEACALPAVLIMCIYVWFVSLSDPEHYLGGNGQVNCCVIETVFTTLLYVMQC